MKSNAIVYAKDGATVGIGAGQMSRVDSSRIAARKALEAAEAAGLAEPLTKGSVVASDAFFPFADGLLAAVEAGATAVIQPGGSMRDDERDRRRRRARHRHGVSPASGISGTDPAAPKLSRQAGSRPLRSGRPVRRIGRAEQDQQPAQPGTAGSSPCRGASDAGERAVTVATRSGARKLVARPASA